MGKVIAAIEARPPACSASSGARRSATASSPSDPLLHAAALSYVRGQSGDLIFATKPGWMISAAGTTHGSATPDDQRVPILFLGHGIKPRRVSDTPASPADLTPTLAAIAGISMAKAEGRPLPCLR